MRILMLPFLALALPAAAQDAEVGKRLYDDICAACHGFDGTGDGPMVPALTVDPPDLTELSARNDGVFPMTRTVYQIDGRDPMIAHGGPMPIFGPYLEGVQSAALKAEDGTPILTSPAIADLVMHLQSIQK